MIAGAGGGVAVNTELLTPIPKGISLSDMRTLTALLICLMACPLLAQNSRPNILWIVSEDNNPYLGCYGDKLAKTPTIDSLAKEGLLFSNCFAQAPVCAPSRFTLITGVYATSAQPANHMRAQGKLPDHLLEGFPALLRKAGYYCTNSAKTDYNAPINIKATWDESSKKAHWRNRPAGKPFFAVFNHEVTHESSIHGKQRPLPEGKDPSTVRIPAYAPDTPETRADRALYYDNLRRLDGQVATLLKQLDEDGLAQDTIVFYFADNGGVLPRSKRFAYDSGLRVPLIARFPARFTSLSAASSGATVEAPVSWVDMAPTILSLVGIDIPNHYQGHAFLGPKAQPQQYAFSFRDRMDERYDFVRTARDKQFRYIRNYRPDIIWGQHVQYLWQQKGMQVWEQLHKAGKLNPVQDRFWGEKPAEELYDLQADPDEVNNLAGNPEYMSVMERMRRALREHLVRTRDNGFLPEGSAGEGYASTRDDKTYPIAKYIDIADVVTRREVTNLPKFQEWMADPDATVRYWGALGCVMLREKAAPAAASLIKLLDDPSDHVKVVAAESLAFMDKPEGVAKLASLLTDASNNRIRLQAANSLDHLGGRAKPALAAFEKAASDADDYVKRAARYSAAVLAGKKAPGEHD